MAGYLAAVIYKAADMEGGGSPFTAVRHYRPGSWVPPADGEGRRVPDK